MKKKRGSAFRNNLITTYSHRSPEAEAFKILRTNLQFLTVDKEVKTILFTSTAPDEGKSTLISNLAITLAQSEKKILLIDCDLRMPVQHKIFSVLNDKGLTNLITDTLSMESCIQQVNGFNLELLTSGPIPPNPSEMLDSERMMKILAELKEKYDYILLDGPPVLAVTDASLLGSKVDGVIMVTAVGNTRIDRAKEAKEALLRGKARILGVILNGVERGREDQYYYYYYGEKK
jgi:capsular exopolysaccharide synthesis family protein